MRIKVTASHLRALGAGSLLAASLIAACTVGDTDPEVAAPAPEATTAVPLEVTPLRYCLADDLGLAAPTVAQLLTELAAAPGEGAIELTQVTDLSGPCRYDNPDIDFVVSSWGDAGACRDTTDGLACSVRSLLVDTDDLGASTPEKGDPDVAESLRFQLDYNLSLGLGGPGAPPLTAPDPVEPAATGCGGVAITQVLPANPNAYQMVHLAAIYQVDTVNCSTPQFVWTSSIDGAIGSGSSTSYQLSQGSHVITFAVSVVCVDPNDPTQTPATYTCADSTALDVAEGYLEDASYCDRSAQWWQDWHAQGIGHIQTATIYDITMTGTNLPDLLIGNDFANKINGRRAGDCLIGKGEADLIEGHGGHDWIEGNDGPDNLLGHDDGDRIYGGRDNDRVRGGWGGDWITGEDGDDDLDGNYDKDTIYGGDGDDRLLGGMDNDTLWAGRGDDCVRGDSGDDSLYGEDGGDVVVGEFGVDTLHGGAGDDHLNGGNDADILYGDDGNDGLRGGLGDDRLNGDDGDDALCGGGGTDIKDGGADINGDRCHIFGTNINCETTPAFCPAPQTPSC